MSADDYVLTVDNLLKIISIQLRLKFGLPVVIMGETGCGKTSLISYMCSLLGSRLHVLNVHGGITDDDITTFMNDVVAEARADRTRDITVFFDEINTCNSMSLFKSMVCDGVFLGAPVPGNVKMIAACNPYRLKPGKAQGDEASSGLVYRGAATGVAQREGTFRGTLGLGMGLDAGKGKGKDKSGKSGKDKGKAGKANSESASATASANTNANNSGGGGGASGITDPMARLVYRVHPLPASMADLVYDFGSLSLETETLYIGAMLRNGIESAGLASSASGGGDGGTPSKAKATADAQQGDAQQQQQAAGAVTGLGEAAREAERAARRAARLAAGNANAGLHGPAGPHGRMDAYEGFILAFTEILARSQQFVRDCDGNDRSAVSLRDISRCIKVFNWFMRHLTSSFSRSSSSAAGSVAAAAGSSAPVVVNLRRMAAADMPTLHKAIVLSLAFTYHARLPRLERASYRSFLQQVTRTLPSRVKTSVSTWLDLSPSAFAGILTATQLEFVRHMTLGDGIALNEALCENLFLVLVALLNTIPIFVVGKPGSSKSLAVSLVSANLNGEASDAPWLRSLPRVEVFSFQCSPMATARGIQGTFDAARRYARDVGSGTKVVVLLDELGLAEASPHLPLKVLHRELERGDALGVIGISNWALDAAKMNRAVYLYRPAPTVEDLTSTAEGMVRSSQIKGYLGSIARAYAAVYDAQAREGYIGLRDFYAFVRSLNASLEAGGEMDASTVALCVLRNFGGMPEAAEAILGTFLTELGLARAAVGRVPEPIELIEQSLADPVSRHLMLLSHGNAALDVLFDRGIVSHANTEVMWGSNFPSDLNDASHFARLQRVKRLMENEGQRLILVQCESLYESLYDLLNQNVTSYGGVDYVRLAYGSTSKLCPIARGFKIITIVEESDARHVLPPPLLNRFEKQLLVRGDLLSPMERRVAERLAEVVRRLAGSGLASDARRAFAGFHADMVSGLVLAAAGGDR
jgi:energy-coupling factor transporter ATP-binding protein EcfA2